jgi:beta-galactosidase
MVTAGNATQLCLTPDWVFGEDLFYFTADILDKNGNPVPDADNLLSFSVKGPMEIVATDAGDPTSHVPFYSTSLPAFHGKASVILRRTGEGPVTVTVKGKGLKGGKLSFQVPMVFEGFAGQTGE